jgi:hypothetical protein
MVRLGEASGFGHKRRTSTGAAVDSPLDGRRVAFRATACVYMLLVCCCMFARLFCAFGCWQAPPLEGVRV